MNNVLRSSTTPYFVTALRPPHGLLLRWMEELLGDRRNLRVLQAGCGHKSDLHFGPTSYTVGIDSSPEQLARNVDVDEKLLGDLETFDFGQSDFDVIYCSNVLEHLDAPLSTMQRFADALKPDGLLVLRIPNPLSVKGLITKLAPFPVHVWFYQRVLGYANHTGRGTAGPFPTYMRMALAPMRLKRHAEKYGLTLVRFHAYEDSAQRKLRERLRVEGWRWSLVKVLVRTVTLRLMTAEGTDLAMVLQKRREVAGDQGSRT